MHKYALLIFVVFTTNTYAQYSPVFHVTWGAVTTQVDTTVIDSANVSYVIYDSETGTPVCATQALECNVDVIWGQCMTMHATAKYIPTSQESAASNTVNACAGVRPDFPLSAPIIEVVIDNSGGQ